MNTLLLKMNERLKQKWWAVNHMQVFLRHVQFQTATFINSRILMQEDG